MEDSGREAATFCQVKTCPLRSHLVLPIIFGLKHDDDSLCPHRLGCSLRGEIHNCVNLVAMMEGMTEITFLCATMTGIQGSHGSLACL